MKEIWDTIRVVIMVLGAVTAILLIAGMVLTVSEFFHKVWVHVNEPQVKEYLPDGSGFFIKNTNLSQEMVDMVPVGETIYIFGNCQARDLDLTKRCKEEHD